MNLKIFSLILGVSCIALLSCGNQDGKSGSGGSNSTAPAVAPNAATDTGKVYYCWVDNANLRESPSIDAKVITQIKQGDQVTTLGPVTKDLLKIVLREVEFNQPWYQVKTADGKTGWVNAAVLVDTQVDSFPPKGLIVIFCASSVEETSEDWAWFTDTVFQVAKANNIEAVFADEKALKKPVLTGEDQSHPTLGVNLAKFVKDGGFDLGYIFYKPGKSPKFQDHDMVGPVLSAATAYFGVELSEDSILGD
ncbi:MAG: SH3 domain-containing protein [Brevinematales bacterium]|nr:SH3 domain-containing protein [Brevinematales bacterium]